jgi:V/A-type H+-transporting ATPase subunit K
LLEVKNMDGYGYAVLGAALAMIFAGSGSAVGIGNAASASCGVMTEDPKNFGRYLLLLVLPGTQGLYGFLIGFLILFKIGFVTAQAVSLSVSQGLQFLSISLPIAFTGLVSAIHQGKVCASGIFLTAKQPTESGKAILMAVFVETYAVFGLIISFFGWLGIKV